MEKFEFLENVDEGNFGLRNDEVRLISKALLPLVEEMSIVDADADVVLQKRGDCVFVGLEDEMHNIHERTMFFETVEGVF